ncbi:MAG TPA: ribosome maturation factor RimP [Acidimicrobiales bacterium]|nr:ribosome maturation factor RimP [Acidimicrobiales bacterium]
MASEELGALLSPLLDATGLELVDLEVQPGRIRVTVDRQGGVDLDTLAEANRAVSAALDRVDPLEGRYVLEVTSPGLERPLRTPAHFRRAIGATVTVRTLPGGAEARRMTGRLAAADDEQVVLEGPEVPGGRVRLAYEEIERARTVFEWGPARPASASRRHRAGRGARAGGGARAQVRPATDATTERVTTQ